MFHTLQPLILASGSARRQNYLKDMGLSFAIQTRPIQEIRRENESPDYFVIRMAREKARVVSREYHDSWVIGGDTIVCLGEQVFGKPTSEDQAVAMLGALCGCEHRVKTGFCVRNERKKVEEYRVVETKVTFAQVSEELIRGYVATGEPLDKAGAYGIQGKGAMLVEKIVGSYSNVVGLPLAELMQLLLDLEIIEAKAMK